MPIKSVHSLAVLMVGGWGEMKGSPSPYRSNSQLGCASRPLDFCWGKDGWTILSWDQFFKPVNPKP